MNIFKLPTCFCVYVHLFLTCTAWSWVVYIVTPKQQSSVTPKQQSSPPPFQLNASSLGGTLLITMKQLHIASDMTWYCAGQTYNSAACEGHPCYSSGSDKSLDGPLYKREVTAADWKEPVWAKMVFFPLGAMMTMRPSPASAPAVEPNPALLL